MRVFGLGNNFELWNLQQRFSKSFEKHKENWVAFFEQFLKNPEQKKRAVLSLIFTPEKQAILRELSLEARKNFSELNDAATKLDDGFKLRAGKEILEIAGRRNSFLANPFYPKIVGILIGFSQDLLRETLVEMLPHLRSRFVLYLNAVWLENCLSDIGHVNPKKAQEIEASLKASSAFVSLDDEIFNFLTFKLKSRAFYEEENLRAPQQSVEKEMKSLLSLPQDMIETILGSLTPHEIMSLRGKIQGKERCYLDFILQDNSALHIQTLDHHEAALHSGVQKIVAALNVLRAQGIFADLAALT